LEALHPGATLEEVRATMGWEVQVSAQLGRTPPPSAEELHLLRDVLDPERHYLR
jgi:glutaconate CoA-transferase subunit B